MSKPPALWLLILPLTFGVYACTQFQAGNPSAPSPGATLNTEGALAAGAGATPASAVVTFGRPDTGSRFLPTSMHDQSAHAKDNLTPRMAVIDAGGSVTFEVPPNVHQLAIYRPGKEVRDINVGLTASAPAPCPQVPLINDPVLRLAVETRPCFQPWQHTQTFSTPGRYLVICTFTPHFNVGMYGWVIVRNRQD